MPAPVSRERKKVLKCARGRGNQGDWVPGTTTYGEEPEHKDWNAQVEEKRRLKGKRK